MKIKLFRVRQESSAIREKSLSSPGKFQSHKLAFAYLNKNNYIRTNEGGKVIYDYINPHLKMLERRYRDFVASKLQQKRITNA